MSTLVGPFSLLFRPTSCLVLSGGRLARFFSSPNRSTVRDIDSSILQSSLQPFEKKLKKRYQRVFNLDDGLIEVDHYIEELFRNPATVTEKKNSASDIDGSQITMTISINNADLRTVQQFCWDLTERVGIGKFDFFESKSSSESKSLIHCDEVTAHYHMTEQLLNLLNGEAQEKTKALVEYALSSLPQHLEQVIEALKDGELGATARKAITKRLVKLLSDVEGIRKFWDTIHDMHEYWATRETVQIIEDWSSLFAGR